MTEGVLGADHSLHLANESRLVAFENSRVLFVVRRHWGECVEIGCIERDYGEVLAYIVALRGNCHMVPRRPRVTLQQNVGHCRHWTGRCCRPRREGVLAMSNRSEVGVAA